MLRNLRDVVRHTLHAPDGAVGTVEEFYFDEEFWTVRYLVVRPGDWMPRRHVLISPVSLGGIDDGRGIMQVTLTLEQIKNSPSIDVDEPITEEHERRYYDYYALPLYWNAAGRWGAGLYPSSLLASESSEKTRREVETRTGNPHLRGTKAIAAYAVEARDGKIGSIDDFIIDDATWAISYLAVVADALVPGKRTLFSPHWIDRISDHEKKILLEISADAVREAPAYDPSMIPDRQYETALFRHYGREDDLSSVRVKERTIEYR